MRDEPGTYCSNVIVCNVGRNFYDDGPLRPAFDDEFSARGHDARQEFVECGRGLQVSKSRGIGRRNVYSEIACDCVEDVQSQNIIGRSV